ncbi:MAG TPA: enoyl-CoA hydratase [Methylophilaceae bacterium]|nr:enoyl-CoA hydratase [Methylophilaceae bacterium]HAJ71301.1 enoyl-CoA hydratase [Methylophilaceae bacterium]
MDANQLGLCSHCHQLTLRYDETHEVLWTIMSQNNMIPCFNSELIAEITSLQKEIEKTGGVLYLRDKVCQIKYVVIASSTPNVFNLGGHLSLMRDLAKSRQKEALQKYATLSIDALYHKISRFNNTPVITVSLLQGLTLGAGLEAALTSDVVIAERKTLLSFPEVLFNMFPGMGGYSLVARKAGNKVADEMILKGKQYTAEQAYEMGIVDVLVDDGQGEKAVYDWIDKNKRFFNGHLATYKAKNRINPITYDELMDITQMWVDVALKLTDREFSIMDRFIYSQEKQYLKTGTSQSAADNSNVVSFKRA